MDDGFLPINHQRSTAFPHEKLEVWRVAKSFAREVYVLTSAFPREERFGLVNQMRRAAVSVMSNLAEGCGRTGAKDQAHFSQIAFASLLEVDSQLQLSIDLGFINRDDYGNNRETVLKLIKKISALRASQLKRVSR
ncbi:MAG: four helix bundle protein [Ghiorsea sp.]|nr:four helix bundle protein [Ghiorsea sp.]